MRSADIAERQSTRRQSVALIVGGAALVTTPPTLLLGWAVSEYLWELWWLNAGSSGLLDGVPDRPVVVRAVAGLVLLLVAVLFAVGVVTRIRARGELTATAAVRWALLGAAIPIAVLASALVLQSLLAGPEQPPFVPFS
ncbi:hypothetical protein [Cellulosimicrobium sp. Marseille-Q4280]|jgi:hypothetical protein|uniref:hypothetical protein n=1 Tax=Cellulosimicrobium sp. Marseille-Q4280 TaxID=2937992 RepID=UPI00203BB138|nr:hypothetical protein [Cellulosimicrobium sp. Marseille-Q4280]